MKLLTILLVFLSVLTVATLVYAHQPSDINLTFNSETKILEAVIVHNTSNPIKHYISKVDIGVNGEEIIEQKISKQDNNQTQTLCYLIPDVKAGDAISVEGYCSISGKLTREITVE